jgi:ubiquinone/menaquinone biosynthesis C-methylase UbiE
MMHEKRFNREIERLRDPERLARLEVDRVIRLSLEGLGQIKSMIDIGMGSGVFAEAFGAKGLRISGVDVNPEMLPAALAFVPSATFKEGTAEKLPFADAAFDLAFMGLLLHETDNTLAALKEACRVVQKRLVILEWPYEEQPFGPPLEHRISGDKITSLSQQAGFKKIDITPLQNLILYRCDSGWL